MFDFIINRQVVCDDVRVERNGKVILIGVYPNDVIVSPAFPAQIVVSIYFEMFCNEVGAFDGLYRVVNGGAEVLPPRPMRVHVESAAPFFTYLAFVQFPAEEPGQYVVELEVGNRRKSAATINVRGLTHHPQPR